jgi:hypothetical protein
MRLFMRHHTASSYQTCQELFARYPLAARAVDPAGTTHSMVLVHQDGDDGRFFVLSRGRGDGQFIYSLCSWPAGRVVDIEADGDASISELARKVVAHGVPLPRHGSMFGWTGKKDVITALILFYSRYEPARPFPLWTVMPLAEVPQPQWPSFTGRPLFGSWFWEHYQDGSIIPLDRLIAYNADAVFWVNTQAILGSDCCAVARDISSPEGHTLRRGRYVYSEALQVGAPLPSLTALLSDPGKTDLAPRFRRSATVMARGTGGLVDSEGYVPFRSLATSFEVCGYSYRRSMLGLWRRSSMS